MLQQKKREAYLQVAQLTGIYSGKRPNEHATILDAQAKRVNDTVEKMEACVAFFEKLYNYALAVKLPAEAEPEEPRPPPKPPLASELPLIYSSAWAYGLPLPRQGGDLGVAVCEPSLEEVSLAMKGLNNNKAPGASGVTAELLKFGGEAGLAFVHQHIVTTWRFGCAPPEWKHVRIVILHKGGSRANLDNYRRISLLDIIGKVYTRVLLGRLQAAMDCHLEEA